MNSEVATTDNFEFDLEELSLDLELVDEETKQGWDMVIAGWSARRAIATLGYLNKLIWKVCKEAGALVKVGEKADGGSEHKVCRAALTQLVRRSLSGLVNCRLPLKGFIEYLARWWQGAIAPLANLKAMRQIREDLSALGLFDFEKGEVGSREVPMVWAIDLPLVLQFYRHLERAYLRMTGGELESLPEHKGSNVVRLFNTLFAGLMPYRKEGDDTNPQQTRKERVETQEDGNAETFYGGGKRLSFREFTAAKTRWTAKGVSSWLGVTLDEAADRLRQWANSPSDIDEMLGELPF